MGDSLNTALQETITTHIYLRSDATSVLYGATGQWSFDIGDQLLRRVRALYHLLWTMVRDEALHAQHIKAHAGHAGNELADLVAKKVRDDPKVTRVPDINLARWMHGEPPLIEWAWVMTDFDHRHGDVPDFYQQHIHWRHWTPPSQDL